VARQRVRCRNPECGTFDISNHEAQANDMTPAGLYKGIIIALNFIVLCVTGSLGLLAVSSSLFWAAGSWTAGGLLLYAMAKVSRRLDAVTVVQYHYACALCGKVWGDVSMDEAEGELLPEREAVAA
jgi:hypothetical protein